MTLITYFNKGNIKYLASDSQETFHIVMHQKIPGLKFPKSTSINKIFKIGNSIWGYSGRLIHPILNILSKRDNFDYDKILEEIDSERLRSQPAKPDKISSGGAFRIIIATNEFTKELIFNPGKDHLENTINVDFNLNETTNMELLYVLWKEIYDSSLTEFQNIENYYKTIYSNEKYHFYGIGGDIKIYSIDKDNNIDSKIIEAPLNYEGDEYYSF